MYLFCQLFLISMKSNDELSYILLCKKGVFRCSKGLASKNCSTGKPPYLHFSGACLSNRTVVANTFLPIEADMLQHLQSCLQACGFHPDISTRSPDYLEK